jgi:hypothetical protein
MKKRMVLYVAAAVLAGSLPAMAAVHSADGHDADCLKACQVLARNCGQETDSLQQRITKLKVELGKGTSAYTAEELKILERKLGEAQENLATIILGG